MPTTTLKIKGVSSVYVLYSAGASPSKEQIIFTRAVGLDVPVSNIDFLGDNQTETLYSIDKVTASIEADKFTDIILERLYTKTSYPQTGEISRYYFGDENEETGKTTGLEVNLLAQDDATGTKRTVRVTLYKGHAMPYRLPAANSKEKHGMAFNFEAVKTSTDVCGAAIPSCPTGGAYYSIAILSS